LGNLKTGQIGKEVKEERDEVVCGMVVMKTHLGVDLKFEADRKKRLPELADAVLGVRGS
jgi:hypothetical protein